MIIQSKYGIKYTCFACGCKFYDLNKPDAICPKCKVDQKDRPKDYEEDEIEVISQRDDELDIDDEKESSDGYSDKDFMVDEEDETESGDSKVHMNVEFYDDDEDNGLIKDQ